jgi:hypothetical protein
MNKSAAFERGSLWSLILGPSIWMLHFLFSYVTAAVWCAKAAGRNTGLDVPRIAIGVCTLAALLGISFIAWREYRQYRFVVFWILPHHEKTADAQCFLGFTTLLLCVLSFVATLYSVFAIVFIGSCR